MSMQPMNDQSEEAAVLAAERALYDAQVAVDLEALEKILAPDLAYIHSTAVVEDKAEYLAGVAKRFYDYKAINSRSVTTRIQGALAVMNGTLDMDVATGGGPVIPMKLLFTLIWTKHDGAWKLSLRQATNMRAS